MVSSTATNRCKSHENLSKQKVTNEALSTAYGIPTINRYGLHH